MPNEPLTQTGANLGYTIATILFALSLISERISNLYKLYRPSMRNKFLKKEDEKIRERKVMWTALICSWIVSVLAGADLFTLLQSGKLLDIFGNGLPTDGKAYVGFFLSGIFTSLGSKFWHDMLDIVLQFSNLKKYQSDQQMQNTRVQETVNNARLKEVLTQKTENILPKLKQLASFSGYDILNAGAGVYTVQLKFLNTVPAETDQQWFVNYYTPEAVTFKNLDNKIYPNGSQTR